MIFISPILIEVIYSYPIKERPLKKKKGLHEHAWWVPISNSNWNFRLNFPNNISTTIWHTIIIYYLPTHPKGWKDDAERKVIWWWQLHITLSNIWNQGFVHGIHVNFGLKSIVKWFYRNFFEAPTAPALFLVYLFIGLLGFIRDHLPTHFLNIYFRGINDRSMVRRGAEYYQDLDIKKDRREEKQDIL